MKYYLWKTFFTFLLLVFTATTVSADYNNARKPLNEVSKRKWHFAYGGDLTNYFNPDSYPFFSEPGKSRLEKSASGRDV